MVKRLFIFASWDKDCIIDDTVLYYLRALSDVGDIVFATDCDTIDTELEKVRAMPNVLHIISGRHGEYDFGSYKRGYEWARKKGILKNYDWMYIANDSVFGPFRPLKPVLEELESNGAECTGMAKVHGKETAKMCEQLNLYHWEKHIQSWFVGFRHEIFTTDWFADFLCGVEKQEKKIDIVLKYEVGLSQLVLRRGFELEVLERELSGMKILSHPLKLLACGMPFLKKQAIVDPGIVRGAKRFVPAELWEPMVQNIRRNELAVVYSTAWRMKLWRLTLVKCEVSRDKRRLRYWILRLLPITVTKTQIGMTTC